MLLITNSTLMICRDSGWISDSQRITLRVSWPIRFPTIRQLTIRNLSIPVTLDCHSLASPFRSRKEQMGIRRKRPRRSRKPLNRIMRNVLIVDRGSRSYCSSRTQCRCRSRRQGWSWSQITAMCHSFQCCRTRSLLDRKFHHWLELECRQMDPS